MDKWIFLGCFFVLFEVITGWIRIALYFANVLFMVQMIREERILDTDQEYHKMVMVAVSYKVK